MPATGVTAAMAPPSIPTIRIGCWTIAGAGDAGFEAVRRRISTTGSKSIAVSGITSRRFSPERTRRRPRESVAGSNGRSASKSGRAAAHFGFPSPVERNSFNARCASSNMSAGTILPRMRSCNFSMIARHSASTSGVSGLNLESAFDWRRHGASLSAGPL